MRYRFLLRTRIPNYPEIIRPRLDYWTLVLGPKFSKKDRAAIPLHRHYSLNQVEYARNFVFRRHFPIHKIFERSPN